MKRQMRPEQNPRMNESTGDSAPLCASVVIASHNRCTDLLECLASLEAECAGRSDIEIIVVDDASEDDTQTQVQKQYPQVRTIRLDSQHYASASRNTGSHAARGKLLLYVDSDGVVAPGWLAAMLAADDGETVLLGCPVDFEGGRVQGTPRRATFLGKSLKCSPERANTGPSCNLGIPKKCFQDIGGFDEELPYYFEDSDLCIRANKAGFRFKYLPDAVFRHKGNESKKGDAIRMQERNSTYAMLKAYHPNLLKLWCFSFFNALWLVLRFVLWTFCGRGADALLLLRGWHEGNAEYLRKVSFTLSH